MNDAFFDGYNTAANICVDVITKNIDELFSQINSGSFLSDQEQFLLSKLNDLKSETEEKLMASSSLMQDTPYSIFGMLNNADLKFEDAIDSKGKKHTLTTGTFIHMLEQEDEVLRESAYRNFYAGYGSMIHTLAACLNGQTNQLKFNSTARKYASSLACAVDANNVSPRVYEQLIATVYKGNIIKNLIMDCQSYTKYRPNETTGGIFVSWRRKEELPTGA